MDATLAQDNQGSTIFTEFSTYQRLGSRKAVVRIGSVAQPFSILIPNVSVQRGGQGLVTLLSERNIAGGTEGGVTVTRPRRSYGYVTGQLKIFRGDPEIVAEAPEAISDLQLNPASQSNLPTGAPNTKYGRYFKCSSVYSDSSTMRSSNSPGDWPGKFRSTSSFANRRAM